jgi:MscS family membrane protein
VRFHRVAQYSFDVEIFAYVLVRNWDEFLKVQEQLLFGVTEAVERSGTALAIPSQRTYVAGRSKRESSRSPAPLR